MQSPEKGRGDVIPEDFQDGALIQGDVIPEDHEEASPEDVIPEDFDEDKEPKSDKSKDVIPPHYTEAGSPSPDKDVIGDDFDE